MFVTVASFGHTESTDVVVVEQNVRLTFWPLVTDGIHNKTKVRFNAQMPSGQYMNFRYKDNIDGLVQDCSDSSAFAMELLQSST